RRGRRPANCRVSEGGGRPTKAQAQQGRRAGLPGVRPDRRELADRAVGPTVGGRPRGAPTAQRSTESKGPSRSKAASRGELVGTSDAKLKATLAPRQLSGEGPGHFWGLTSMGRLLYK